MASHHVPAVSFAFFVVCSAILGLSGGCGRGGPERVVVSGTVTHQGRPLGEGEIRFLPIKGTQAPMAGAHVVDGKYVVDAKGGVPVGTFKIEIVAYRIIPAHAHQAGIPDADFDLDGSPKEQYLSEKYNTKTELEITIPPGSGKITKSFDLAD